MASVEGDARLPARTDRTRVERSRLLPAVSDAAQRRRRLIDALYAGRVKPGRAVALITRDSARLEALAASVTRRRNPPAWLMVARIRPSGWRLRLWIPLPLAIARFAAGLAARYAAPDLGSGGIRVLREALQALPRCGKVMEVQDQGHSVEVWLL